MRTIIGSALVTLGLLACSDQAPEHTVPQWTLVEDLRIGGADTGAASFAGIVALKFDQDGRAWVIERQAPEIRIFGVDGRYQRTIGRAGQGPGELTATNGFAFAPGGLVWVPDYRLRRYNLFDTAGRSIADHPDLIHSYGSMWNGGVDAQGRLFDVISVRVDTTLHQAFRRFRDSSLAAADTLPLPSCSPGPRRWYRLEAKNGYTIMAIPFDANEVSVVDDAGIYWCSDGARFGATGIAIESGDTVARIAYTRPRLPVAPAARDSQVARLTKQAQEMGAPLPDFSLIPDVQPAVIGIKVDDGGRVWLRTPDSSGTRFDLFTRSGEHLAEVVTSLRLQSFAPLAIRGDTLLGVIVDDDDVPVIVRFHIDRGPPGK